ncbi:hypothetical protein Tco_1529471, partial [Tanacetum coccineum]
DFPDCEDSHLQEFHILSFILGIQISRIVKTLMLAVSTRVSHPQLHFGNPVSKSNRLTFYLLAHFINGLRFT